MKNKIKDIIDTAGQIFEGVKNSVFKKEHIEAIALQRLFICRECPELDIEGKSCVAPGTQPCCSKCGCSLEFKHRALSAQCPIGKWAAVMTEEEEEKLNN